MTSIKRWFVAGSVAVAVQMPAAAQVAGTGNYYRFSRTRPPSREFIVRSGRAVMT